MSRTDATWAIWPVAIALAGMSPNMASAGTWAIVTPPRSRTDAEPAAPSSSVPDSTTDVTRWPWDPRRRPEQRIDRGPQPMLRGSEEHA